MIRPPYENNDIVPQDSRGTSNSNAVSAEQYLSRIDHDDAEEIQAELLALMQEHESLRRSEERFRDFFENSKEAIYSHDLSGRYLMVNRAGEVDVDGEQCESGDDAGHRTGDVVGALNRTGQHAV